MKIYNLLLFFLDIKHKINIKRKIKGKNLMLKKINIYFKFKTFNLKILNH